MPKINEQPLSGMLSVNKPFQELGVYIQDDDTQLVAKLWTVESRPAAGDDCTEATARLLCAAYNLMNRTAAWLQVDPLELADKLDLQQVLGQWGAAQQRHPYASVKDARDSLREQFNLQ